MGRVFASDYLAARAQAWERGRFDNDHPMDPVITDCREQNDVVWTMFWLAFMAGSDWEREHVGRRFVDEMTSANG